MGLPELSEVVYLLGNDDMIMQDPGPKLMKPYPIVKVYRYEIFASYRIIPEIILTNLGF